MNVESIIMLAVSAFYPFKCSGLDRGCKEKRGARCVNWACESLEALRVA
jgi:hypothetical protein